MMALSDTAKPNAVDLRERSWFDYQLLRMVMDTSYYRPFEDRTAIHGTTMYISGGDLDSARSYSYRGHLDSGVVNLNASSFNTSGIPHQFMPYIFIAAHKVLDTIVEWIIGANEKVFFPFTKKIKQYKKLQESPNGSFPVFFAENPIIHSAFFSCYETFTEYRNQAVHKSGISIDQYGTMVINFEKEGTIKYIKSNDMEAILEFVTSLTDCLTDTDDLRNFEITKRKVYLSAKALSNFHLLEIVPPISPCWWSRVHFGFNKTTNEIQSIQSVHIDLDAIRKAVYIDNQPDENESAILEVWVHLEDPWGQPNYMIPINVVEQGGIVSIDLKDLLLSGVIDS